MRPERQGAALALCAAMLVLTGCGMKGDLFLPGEEPEPDITAWPAGEDAAPEDEPDQDEERPRG
ncbi:MAG: hypothetical protein JJT85_03670 [Chromatiales bacterium]|nr:hypothetical protein [Chromatiales bacterium]